MAQQFIQSLWSPYRSRRLLQICIMIGGLVPVSAGFYGAFFGIDMTGPGSIVTLSLDSHFRYLSGLLLGIGLCFWSTVPTIEAQTALFRRLTAIVIVGGLARLAQLVMLGTPSAGMVFGQVMELVVTPLLAVWQGYVSRNTRAKLG